jgi:hypothetical protein
MKTHLALGLMLVVMTLGACAQKVEPPAPEGKIVPSMQY